MPVAKPRTATIARRPLPDRSAPVPIAFATHPASPITIRPRTQGPGVVVDAFLVCANGLPPGTLVEQQEADGLRLIQRRGMVGLVSDAGVKTQASEQGEKTIGALLIAHIKDGVVYRDYTNYVETEIGRRARVHVALFEDAFANRQATAR